MGNISGQNSIAETNAMILGHGIRPYERIVSLITGEERRKQEEDVTNSTTGQLETKAHVQVLIRSNITEGG